MNRSTNILYTISNPISHWYKTQKSDRERQHHPKIDSKKPCCGNRTRESNRQKDSPATLITKRGEQKEKDNSGWIYLLTEVGDKDRNKHVTESIIIRMYFFFASLTTFIPHASSFFSHVTESYSRIFFSFSSTKFIVGLLHKFFVYAGPNLNF
jgi:hypothetical protein